MRYTRGRAAVPGPRDTTTTMRDFEDSTLWRVSAFERVRRDTGTSGFSRLDGPTMLSTTLMADLQRRGNDAARGDVLEVLAACMRHREAALLYLQHEELVWPVTVFPAQMIYHSPRDMALASDGGLAELKLLNIEPPGVLPPGHWKHERVGRHEHYRSLAPLLWQMALKGPRSALLAEIGGTAAYRALGNAPGPGLQATGALGSAVERLRRDSASLRDMAAWPGLSLERAGRLLNGLYLASALMVMRTHPSARPQPGVDLNRKPRR